MTYRQKNKIFEDYNWVHLDLDNDSTVMDFIHDGQQDKYFKIILLSGNSMGKPWSKTTLKEMSNYYQSYLINYILLIMNLVEYLEDSGQIVFISSIAADIPIEDAHYSAAKAGVEAFCRSVSIGLKKNQSIFSISPTTITDSMREEIANIILNADTSYNGKTIDIK